MVFRVVEVEKVEQGEHEDHRQWLGQVLVAGGGVG